MPASLTNYRIFIATPGGLDNERAAFRRVIEKVNDSDAKARGLLFTAVGWEDTIRGVGRPQATINSEIETSDYFLLVLWDRWGSAPDTSGTFTSGVEEEFSVAESCYLDCKKPLRQLIVMFKAVDKRQLSDPGSQLTAVLKFKTKLEREKVHFFDSFDDEEAFSERLRRYLSHWIRDYESGGAPNDSGEKLADSEDADVAEVTEEPLGPHAGSPQFLKEAQDLMAQGRLTEAESTLVNAVVSGGSLSAFNAYGRFLTRERRFADAERVFLEMQRLATDADEISWAGSALAGLGGVYRMRPDFRRAHAALSDALDLKRKVHDESGEAWVSLWLGDTHFGAKHWTSARRYYSDAMSIWAKLGFSEMEADACFKVAKAALRDGAVTDAQKLADDTKLKYEALRDTGRLKALKAWRRDALNKALAS